MNRATANLLLLLAGAIWGMGFIAQSTAMESLGPWAYTGIKFLIGGMVLVPLARREGKRSGEPLGQNQWLGFGLIGIFLFGGSILQQIGMVTTSVTNAGFLTGLYVIITPILTLVLFRSRVSRVVWVAAPLAFAGIVLTGGGHLGPLANGDLLVIAGAFFWALQLITIGRLAPGTGRPFTLSCVQFFVAAALSLAGATVLEAPTLAQFARAWVEIAYAGLFSVALGFTLQVIGQRYTTAPQAAVMLSSETLFAGLFGALLLGERLGVDGLIGCAMIFTAMLLVELWPVWQRQRLAAAEL
ncbi:DMT family transporter [Aureimonas fodinaquatilis]|uniref:DMT family transporter n=1 Tax=Aureimonas fodinaquatilis TaxID=2565783 RepID=A0A5B0E1F1_9HYPH|nr:DMT family transporter [Aureimonas fodinaquatilis]KAA0971791.1 DMT family transporter [Aureimonas fodinaquatilis]